MTKADPLRAQAARECDAVNQALTKGHHPTGLAGKTDATSALRAAADACGGDRNAFRHRVGTPTTGGLWWRKFKMRPDWSLYKPVAHSPIKMGGTVEDRRLLALKDEVQRLRGALTDAHRKALDDDAIREVLGIFTATDAAPPAWIITPPEPKRKAAPTPEVPIMIWSDWHLGERVNLDETNGINEYSLEIAERRIRRLVDSSINLCQQHHTGNYPGAVVNLLGDFVSGGLHPELAKTDDEEVIPATLRARDLLVASLSRLADVFGRLYVPCAAGNHGRNTVKPEFKRYVYKNFDWLLYQLLIRHFATDPRIQFDVRPSNDVHYRVFGERYLALHGDMLGVKGGDGIIGAIGPIMRGEVKKSGQSAAVGLDFDKLLMGHWHQQLWLPRAIVANTPKGFDEYARLQLGAKPTRPSQPLWFVHPSYGITAHWDVWVDQRLPESREWISWSGRRAA